MVAYNCVCCLFETDNKAKYTRHVTTQKHLDIFNSSSQTLVSVEEKHIKAMLEQEERYNALLLEQEKKYKFLEEKYNFLEEKYNFLQEKGQYSNYASEVIVPSSPETDEPQDKVNNVCDMLSKTQYDTPSLEELNLTFEPGDYELSPIDGMIRVLSRIEKKPFQYVNGRWFTKQHNAWSPDKERLFVSHIQDKMMKSAKSVFEDNIGDTDLKSEQWLQWILNSFKKLESHEIKHILRAIR